MRLNISKLMISVLVGGLLAFGSCVQRDENALKEIDATEYVKMLEANLHSKDWQTRLDALKSVKALGWQARNLVIQALSDRSDVISRSAQAWFVDHGEQALDYLIHKLLSVEEDIGLYASIAGGKDRNRGKSIAGSIWMTLVRGLPRDRCYDVMKSLVHHKSPKVRAIVLYTAASLRSSKFLEFFDILTNDTDPLVREKFKFALVRLLILDWYSTPELDEPSVSHCLSLLEPELIAIMDGEARADIGILTLGEVLGRDVLPFHRERFISLLENIIPQLSEGGAARAGMAIERQCWIIKDRDKYPNSAWIGFEGRGGAG